VDESRHILATIHEGFSATTILLGFLAARVKGRS
jgi:hypothetical protein